MVGIQREDWLRARNAQFVRLSSICWNDCGDTCGRAPRQAAREGMVPVLPEEDVERLDAAEAIQRKICARAGIGRMWGPPCQRAQRCMDRGCSDDGHVICPAFSSGASSDGGAMIG